MTGLLELTKEPCAIAKIAVIKLCESMNRQFSWDYRNLTPTNLCGPGDNYHPQNSHITRSLLRRFHEAKIKTHIPQSKWKAITTPTCSHMDVGSGVDNSIVELAQLIAEVANFKGNLIFAPLMLDGAPRKLIRLKASGWQPTIELKIGLASTYQSFTELRVI